MQAPPLTCAGRVLQASPLPEWGQGLAFGHRCGPGGHVGGHVPGSWSWALRGWSEGELSVSALQRTERRSNRGGGRGWRDGGVGGERCSIDAGREGYRWPGDGCSQRICFVCVLRAYEQGFPDGLFQCGAAEHPSAAKQAPPRWNARAWAAPHTQTHIHTSAQFCCCHDNHRVGSPVGKKVVYSFIYSKVIFYSSLCDIFSCATLLWLF